MRYVQAMEGLRARSRIVCALADRVLVVSAAVQQEEKRVRIPGTAEPQVRFDALNT